MRGKNSRGPRKLLPPQNNRKHKHLHHPGLWLQAFLLISASQPAS
ncbi:unnamed protein product, partial [Gulo gulo]